MINLKTEDYLNTMDFDNDDACYNSINYLFIYVLI
jgi:hypothetical protein